MMIKSNKIVPIRMIKELSYDKKINEAEWTLKSNDDYIANCGLYV